MNNRQLIILLLVLTVVISCKKDETYGEETISYDITSMDITNSKWVLQEGFVYLDNLDDGSKTYYDHFSSTKTTSTLNIFEGSPLTIDNISKGNTGWEFQNDIFTLNDTSTYPYSDFNAQYGNYQIYGLENGSARPIEIVKRTENSFSCKIHEAWQSDGVTNYSYVSVLTFLEVGTSCNDCSPRVNKSYDYIGTIFNPTSSSIANDIASTKWVITRYDEGNYPYYPNDTIEFISNELYTTNKGPAKNYSLYSVSGTNNSSLTLYYSPTLGGSFSGKVNASFISDGQISNSVFTDAFDGSNEIKVWMKKL